MRGTVSAPALLLTPLANTNLVSAAESKVSFNRDIRPIFSDNCTACHGPAAKARNLEKSELWQRVTTKDPNDIMPPPDSHKTLKPASEADCRTLARRLSLDLTGLPPKPEAVEAFVKDKSPDYYEKFGRALMASSAWGEHRGRYWLDAARYADTHGLHFDNYREMWPYRDWVIKAFNKNMRFDQFTLEQIAGDLLDDPTTDQKTATGFAITSRR